MIKAMPQCLKITEKVSFNSASEASYLYILYEKKGHQKYQKLVNFASNWVLGFWDRFVNLFKVERVEY